MGVVVGEGGVGERDRPAAGVQAAPLAGAAAAWALSLERLPPPPPWALSLARVELVSVTDPPLEYRPPPRVLAGAAGSRAAQRRVRVKDDVVEPEGAAVVEDATALGGG